MSAGCFTASRAVKHPTSSPSSILTCAGVEYVYKDANGAPRMRVVRTADKRFYQQKPDGSGGWMNGVKGVEKVVCRLDELQGKSEIFIAEGEKDVDRVWSEGIPATSNSGGAAAKWTQAYTEQLIMAGVERAYVVPDHDAPGAKHADQVARSLTAAGIGARIVELGLETKGADVSDFLASHSVDDLKKLAKSAPVWTPATVEAPNATTSEGFVLNERKAIRPNHGENVSLALDLMGCSPTFDEFSHTTHVDGVPFDDEVAIPLWLCIERSFDFKPTRDLFDAVVKNIGWQHKYHPVVDYLAGLRWDGEPRLDSWLVTHGGAEDTPYVRSVAPLVLLAAVRRVRHPGVKFDELLVLESEQGTLKSSALRTLCPNEAWFSDDLPIGATSKEIIERTSGKWIVEAADLHGKRQKAADQVKSFLSRQVDGPVRLAYARLATEVRVSGRSV